VKELYNLEVYKFSNCPISTEFLSAESVTLLLRVLSYIVISCLCSDLIQVVILVNSTTFP